VGGLKLQGRSQWVSWSRSIGGDGEKIVSVGRGEGVGQGIASPFHSESQKNRRGRGKEIERNIRSKTDSHFSGRKEDPHYPDPNKRGPSRQKPGPQKDSGLAVPSLKKKIQKN